MLKNDNLGRGSRKTAFKVVVRARQLKKTRLFVIEQDFYDENWKNTNLIKK